MANNPTQISSQRDPAHNASAVSPSDSTQLNSRALWVGASGNIAAILQNDNTAVTFVGVPTGYLLPIAVKQVNSTGTTASSIVALN